MEEPQVQDGPIIMLPCDHTYEPEHTQGDRLVICRECGSRWAVGASAPTHVVYTVREAPSGNP